MSSDDVRVLDERVECAACEATQRLSEWIASDGRCGACDEPHVIPTLPAAERAVTSGDFEGRELCDVVDAFDLDAVGTTDLLLALGCSAAAALDVSRVVVDGRPRSEWRRWIDETRSEEADQIAEAEAVLDSHGVELEYPEE